MAIQVELSANIAADPGTVWRLLVDASTWKSWWPDCREAQAKDFKALREGSELELVLQPKHQKMTFHPVVDMYTEGKTLSLTHRSAMIQSTTTWFLQEGAMGTRVTVRAVFTGIFSLSMRLLRQTDTVRFSLHSNLRGLKRLAERMA